MNKFRNSEREKKGNGNQFQKKINKNQVHRNKMKFSKFQMVFLLKMRIKLN